MLTLIFSGSNTKRCNETLKATPQLYAYRGVGNFVFHYHGDMICQAPLISLSILGHPRRADVHVLIWGASALLAMSRHRPATFDLNFAYSRIQDQLLLVTRAQSQLAGTSCKVKTRHIATLAPKHPPAVQRAANLGLGCIPPAHLHPFGQTQVARP